MKSEPHIYAMHCDMAFSGVACVKPKLHTVCTCMFPVAEVRLARGLGVSQLPTPKEIDTPV